MPTRRQLLIASCLALAALPVRASLAAPSAPLLPGSDEDQSATLQALIDAAAAAGTPLLLPAGRYKVGNIILPSGLMLQGIPGFTILSGAGSGPLATIQNETGVTVDGIDFDEGAGTALGSERGMVEVSASNGIRFEHCGFKGAGANSIAIRDAAVSIGNCDISDAAEAAIFAMDSRGLMISGCRINGCGNGGVLVWRSASGRDGSILSGNRIWGIRAERGGNGQNGNGINVFRADGVVIADNVIDSCAFTAVRINSGNDTQVRGNTCTRLGEVAIYSEFAFSGSVIAGNVIDGAAAGISMTNFDQGGRLAVCSGNLVRNIAPKSEVNPDTTPYGIHAEADTSITGNVVEMVPGVGISAGYGQFLRDVLISDNIVRSADTGIAVSVAEGAGSARVAGNFIVDCTTAMTGRAWDRVVTADLAADASRFPQLAIEGNTVR